MTLFPREVPEERDEALLDEDRRDLVERVVAVLPGAMVRREGHVGPAGIAHARAVRLVGEVDRHLDERLVRPRVAAALALELALTQGEVVVPRLDLAAEALELGTDHRRAELAEVDDEL